VQQLLLCWLLRADCGPVGCATVVAVMFELADDNEQEDSKTQEFLDTVWNTMPANEGVSFSYQNKQCALAYTFLSCDSRAVHCMAGLQPLELSAPDCAALALH
jgi:hypothetical protein